MKNIEIAKLSGYSASAVCKILKGSTQFSDETILLIKSYQNIESTRIKDLFSDKNFKAMCDMLIESIKKNDYKDINMMLRFITECSNWHDILNNRQDNGIIRRTPTALFKDPLFFIMCDVAIKRGRDSKLKKWVLNLQIFNSNFNFKIQ